VHRDPVNLEASILTFRSGYDYLIHTLVSLDTLVQ